MMGSTIVHQQFRVKSCRYMNFHSSLSSGLTSVSDTFLSSSNENLLLHGGMRHRYTSPDPPYMLVGGLTGFPGPPAAMGY